MKQTIILLVALLALPTVSRAEGYSPDTARIRRGLTTSAPIDSTVRATTATASTTARQNGRRDSVWNGTLIGAGIGVAGGYLWARSQCGSNDAECSAIANPIGIFCGAAIGAAIGAIADAFTR